jgi:glycosyltransferase involved in cell wall biosynthesis/SAM-dependent methyltransferase
MRIALTTSHVPFVRGGAELLAESLEEELVKRGHQVEILKVPFNWYPAAKLRDCMLAGQLLDIDRLGGHPIDLVIGLKFPGYLIQHPNKVFWLLHQHRQAYEQWDQGNSDLLQQPSGREVRSAIWDADRTSFSGHRVYTISRNVSNRLRKYLAIESEALYHPPPIAKLLSPGESRDYVLIPGRLNPSKRPDLVVRALAEADQAVKAVFVGAPDDDTIAGELLALATRLGVADRIKWLGSVTAEKLAELYRHCLAVVFVPDNEDYGYVTLEAMLAGKPVITVTDAGGPLEFIEDGKQGLVSEASPAAIGQSLARLWASRSFSKALGDGALARYRDLNIGWDGVIEQLLTNAKPQSVAATRPTRPTPQLRPLKLDTERPASGPSAAPPTDDAYDFAPNVDMVAKRAQISGPADLLAAFEFGPDADRFAAGHLAEHWLRYLQTAALLPATPGQHVLSLSATRPHVLLGLLKLLDDGASFDAVVGEDCDAVGSVHFPSRRGGEALEVRTAACNVETDALPYPDHSFDTILATEILQHLALNPAHLFAEMARVLRPGGRLIVTTPNIVSDVALQKTFAGRAPYSFGAFVPHQGLYGRHNREYTPLEVELLGRSVGLVTETLMTKDTAVREIGNAHEFAARFEEITTPAHLRGQSIFYTASKSDVDQTVSLSPLYVEDPFAYLGTMLAQPAVPNSPDISILLSNTGRKDWGEQTIDIVFHAVAGEGEVGRSARLRLPIFVPAGERRLLTLPIAPGPGQACCVLMVRLELRNKGPLSRAGVRDIRFVASACAIGSLVSRYAMDT